MSRGMIRRCWWFGGWRKRFRFRNFSTFRTALGRGAQVISTIATSARAVAPVNPRQQPNQRRNQKECENRPMWNEHERLDVKALSSRRMQRVVPAHPAETVANVVIGNFGLDIRPGAV